MNGTLVFALLLAFFAASTTANGDTIYSDLSPSFTGSAWTETGPQYADGQIFQMFQFVPVITGRLEDIVSAARYQGAGPNEGTFIIATDNGGLPGTIVDSTFATGLPLYSTIYSTLFEVTSSSKPILVAGTPYWFGLRADSDSELGLGIVDNSPGITAQSINGGPWKQQTAYYQAVNPNIAAFQLSGEAVAAAPLPTELSGACVLFTVLLGMFLRDELNGRERRSAPEPR